MDQIKLSLGVSQVCGGNVRGLTEVTLTFRRRAHHCRLVSMATVAGDERPAPALAHTVLVATATQALVVEEARAGAELRVLQGRADLTVGTGRKK